MKSLKTKVEEILEKVYSGSNHIGKVYNDEAVAAILQLFKEEIKEFDKNWNKRITEVKQSLDEVYGKNHNYIPNYEGIFEELREEILEETEK